MSLASCCQRRVSRIHTLQLKRNVSSKTTIKSYRSLPPAKMRALISLYHQSETFITPENLLERIDMAFVPQATSKSPTGSLMGEIATPEMVNMKDLTAALEDQRSTPKMTDNNKSPSRFTPDYSHSWSSAVGKRELKVLEALYGVDTTLPEKRQPGLEILEECAEEIESNIRSDASLQRDKGE